MKKVKLIYNPVSGNGILKTKLDDIIKKFQSRGFQIIPYRLSGKDDVDNALKNSLECEIVIAAGGDGTIHDIVNYIKKNNINLPLGIIPSGTSNDFASYLGLPKTIFEAIDVITKQNIEYVDLGKINGRYFINVAAGGILSNIAHKADKNLKNVIGMFAYYLKALEEISNIKPFNVEITYDNKKVTENILMFLVLNSSIAGGFKIAPSAKVNDGMIDICLIKNCTIAEFGTLFIKLLRGEHVDDDKITFFQAQKIKIESNIDVDTDIDGEKGHELPLDIEVLPNSLRVFR